MTLAIRILLLQYIVYFHQYINNIMNDSSNNKRKVSSSLQPTPTKKGRRHSNVHAMRKRYVGGKMNLIDMSFANDKQSQLYMAFIHRPNNDDAQYFLYDIVQQKNYTNQDFITNNFPTTVDLIVNFKNKPHDKQPKMSSSNRNFQEPFLMFIHRPDPETLDPIFGIEHWSKLLIEDIRSYLNRAHVNNKIHYGPNEIECKLLEFERKPPLNDFFFDIEIAAIIDLFWPTETDEDLNNLKNAEHILKQLFGNLMKEELEKRIDHIWNLYFRPQK